MSLAQLLNSRAGRTWKAVRLPGLVALALLLAQGLFAPLRAPDASHGHADRTLAPPLRAAALRLPQPPALRITRAYGGAPGGMAMDGHHLLVGLGTRLRLLDGSARALPQVGREMIGETLVRHVAAVPGGVIVAGEEGGLATQVRWLARSPAGLRPRHAMQLPGRATALVARGDVAWLPRAGRPMAIVAPAEGGGPPQVVTHLSFEAEVHRLRLGPELALVLLGSPGSEAGQELVVLDARDARAPHELGRVHLSFAANDLARVGDAVLLPGSSRGYVVDISHPESPRIVAGDPGIDRGDWWPRGSVGLCAASDGERVWMVDARPGLVAFDLSAPSTPRVTASLPLEDTTRDCLALVGGPGRVARQDETGYIQVFDTRDPAGPRQVASVRQPVFEPNEVVARDGRAWALAADGSALVAFTAQGTWSTQPLTTSWYSQDIALRGNELHVLTRTQLRPFEIAGDGTPRALAPIDLPWQDDFRTANLFSDGQQLAIDAPNAPPLWLVEEDRFLTLDTLPSGPIWLEAVHEGRMWGGALFLPAPGIWHAAFDSDGGFDAQALEIAPLAGSAVQAMAFGERRAYIDIPGIGLTAWRLAEGLPVEIEGVLDVPGTLSTLATLEPHDEVVAAWITNRSARRWSPPHGGLRLLGFRTPGLFDELAHLDLGAPVHDLASAEGRLWLAAGPAGVLAVERFEREPLYVPMLAHP